MLIALRQSPVRIAARTASIFGMGAMDRRHYPRGRSGRELKDGPLKTIHPSSRALSLDMLLAICLLLLLLCYCPV
jgi:hypothetical protein